jgi:hypothetical protein
VDDWQPAWEAFRSAYPYHIQVVSVSKPSSSGNRLLVISEPPPSITVHDIQAVDPVSLSSLSIGQHGIGYDGWVKDALIELPPMAESQLASLVDRIHARIFGTSYKAVAAAIPDSLQFTNANYNLDLHVPAGKLESWLLADRRRSQGGWLWPVIFAILGLWGLRSLRPNRRPQHILALACSILGLYFSFLGNHSRSNRRGKPEDAVLLVPIIGGEARSIRQLLRDKAAGVYMSAEPGLVVWSIDTNTSLEQYWREARQFALDSDIVLGAIGFNGQVAIVARERVAPVTMLPPLRTETILQLASVPDAELAQSYERTHFFAGKFDGEHDWAPIYLSDALIDSEYGSLLNITDQILKSWSMSGMVRYMNFDYPDPQAFPFPQPLIQYVNAQEITFNWNTKGAGYSSISGEYDVLAWTRTGALPVDYLGASNQKLREAEDVGYDYFARRSDPNLVRVVQYAEIYQIFRHYGIKASAPAAIYQARVPDVFRSELLRVLARFRVWDDQTIRRRVNSQRADGLIECKKAFIAIMDDAGQDGANKLATALAAPRLYSRRLNEIEDSWPDDWKVDAAIAKVAFGCERCGADLGGLADMTKNELRKAYVQASNRQTAGWIRTASIVVSKPLGEFAQSTGGHNLDSAITSFRASAEVKPGELKVIDENGRRILLHSDRDTDRIQGAVRTIARAEGASESELARKASAALVNARPDERPLTEVLAFIDNRAPSPRRGFQVPQASAYVEGTGWWASDEWASKEQRSLLAALESTRVHMIVVERKPDGTYILFDGPSKHILEAKTQPAASDAVSAYVGSRPSSTPLRLHLRGFSPREAEGFKNSTELQLAGLDKSPQLFATVEESKMTPDDLRTMLSERYNFREAKITEISQPVLTEDGEETTLGLQAPAKKGRASLLMWVTVRLKNGVRMTSQLLATIRGRVLSIFISGDATVANDDTLLMTQVFVSALKRVSPDIESVRVKVSRQGRDLHIVQNRQSEFDSRRYRRAA